jgi:CYTH domain-containing protein
MREEIERKYLVRSEGWRALATSARSLRQGYLAKGPGVTVRVRAAAGEGRLTLKSRLSGPSRMEFEYVIPPEEAHALLEGYAGSCLVEKVRHAVPCGERLWEVDVFGGLNEGLILAEIELASVEEPVQLPDWVGREVTEDPRFYNQFLAEQPFGQWPREERERCTLAR